MTYVNLAFDVILLAVLLSALWLQWQNRKKLRTFQQQTAPREHKTSGGPILTPPPSPIDQQEFALARMAYLAHLRTKKVMDQETQELRSMTDQEMIEAVSLRVMEVDGVSDGGVGHLEQLLGTWDEVIRKQSGGAP